MCPIRLSLLILVLFLALCGCSAAVPDLNQRGAELESGSRAQSAQPCLNINTATAEELMRLPGVGEVMSRKIVGHRERNGPFRRPEEIIIVDGFSERKYRALAGLICTE